MSNENGKLIVTAVGAAAAGAALAIGFLKYFDKNRYHPERSRSFHTPVFMNEQIPEETSKLTRNNSEATLLFPHNHEEKMRRRVATRVFIEEENNTPRDLVTVRVPATSANVGPGCK
jgi:homoserine kinase